ncbi:MAG TPA: MobA/MobL family protein [Granulicella sp.]|nr:MobA/MobL family protein [Granulicella sp.]
MPEFAQADPRAFWVAADAHERANGRSYTELQIALPRELDKAQRIELAREAAREFMGDRFAYTLALHTPLAKDNIEQPHLHLMFSERAIDVATRALPEEQFFKRNGAKKDRETWHNRDKPEEIRTRWCEMMNRAMEREGIELRVDPRSWADQGREDLAELREPKTLGGRGGGRLRGWRRLRNGAGCGRSCRRCISMVRLWSRSWSGRPRRRSPRSNASGTRS